MGRGAESEERPRGEGGGREARSSKTRGRKRPNTRREGFKARGKGRLRSRENVLCPKEPARQERRCVRREWAGWSQEEAL